MSALVGVASLLFLMIWAGYCALAIFINGMYIGDGTSKDGLALESGLLWLPSLYLVIVLLSALPLVRRWALVVVAVAGHAVLVPSLLLIAHAQGLEPIIIRIALITFSVIEIGWVALISLRFKTLAASA